MVFKLSIPTLDAKSQDGFCDIPMLDAQFQDDFLLKNKKPKAGIFPVSISCVNELGVYGGAWRHESLELIELRDPKAKITCVSSNPFAITYCS